jgi:hypothetical protein
MIHQIKAGARIELPLWLGEMIAVGLVLSLQMGVIGLVG